VAIFLLAKRGSENSIARVLLSVGGIPPFGAGRHSAGLGLVANQKCSMVFLPELPPGPCPARWPPAELFLGQLGLVTLARVTRDGQQIGALSCYLRHHASYF
jgi:hypothetical protein